MTKNISIFKVYSNTIQSMMAILKAMGPLKIEFSMPSRKEDCQQFFQLAQTVEDGLLSFLLKN